VTSLSARLVIALLRGTGQKRFYADPAAMHRSLRSHQKESEPAAWVRRNTTIERSYVQGFPCYTVRPRTTARTDLHILHLHGGAYVEQVERHHWRFAALLTQRLGATVTLPVYPLAPDHSHRTTVPMAEAAYHRFLDSHAPENRILSGDSAGGGLALTLAQRLREQGHPQPAHLAMFSPWLDLTLSDPLSGEIDPRDPMLAVAGLREAGRLYADGADPAGPELSPDNADLSGLGPFSIFIGTRDVLLPEARRLLHHARQVEIDVDYSEYPGMFHNWIMQPIPEASTALDHLVATLTAGDGSLAAGPRGDVAAAEQAPDTQPSK